MSTKNRVIIFRADSSSDLGTGHIMRDLVLAKRDFRDFRVIFATRDLPGNINHKIIESGFEISLLKSDKIEELAELANKMDAETIVIDHYEIGYEEEKLLKKLTGATLFVLDDLYEKHFCDILLNHNVYAEPKRYTGLVPSHCELRCGKEHTLLREEFYAAKQTPKLKRDKKDIFIAMGGTDHKNLIVKILRVLEKIPDIEANVLTTRANRHLDELKEYASSHSFVNLHIESNEVAKLMCKADLAIITPSVIMNEVIFMDTPFIAIQTADNQKEMVGYLIHHHTNMKVIQNYKANELKIEIKKLMKKWEQ